VIEQSPDLVQGTVGRAQPDDSRAPVPLARFPRCPGSDSHTPERHAHVAALGEQMDWADCSPVDKASVDKTIDIQQPLKQTLDRGFRK
jgi:hypothetical protein